MTKIEPDPLRTEILRLVEEYAGAMQARGSFEPGKTTVPPSGKVIGARELRFLVDAALDGWLTTGRYNDEFQARLASFLGVPHVLTVNSGSSANLCAMSALTSPKLRKRRIAPGDEVITVAASFPTTVNPAIINGLVPVFVDIKIPTYNIDASRVEDAIGPRTRAIMIAHTLGNPFDLDEITRIARKHDLWLVEDCCDALGSRYDGKLVGTFGHIGTLSFYPAHHITMGEGGAVFTNDEFLHKIILSIRDWGRDCYCDPGKENTCGKRFRWTLGDLPFGYDHKYTYSHLGYNLKITDMQAAVALAQMDRLEFFIEKRKANFHFLREQLKSLEEFVILPEATPRSDPSWFGFPLTLRANVKRSRHELQAYLDERRIGSRLLFAGNLVRQPYFKDRTFCIHGDLANTDIVMDKTFWLGVYPGLDEAHLAYVVEALENFFDA
jgi:CDP-6-deoxy-D-xylo-4-hexulose-3-dehydrase